MPNPFKTPKRPYHLTFRGRIALRKSIQTHRPWQHSTGPRTPEGKRITSQNNLKHGYYCHPPVFEESTAFKSHLKSLRRKSNKPPTPKIGPPITEE
jgi:hypothetical protein